MCKYHLGISFVGVNYFVAIIRTDLIFDVVKLLDVLNWMYVFSTVKLLPPNEKL